MALKNSIDGYGWPARLLHWVMALAIFAMFGLGLWMVTLDYYSPYNKSAPDLHKSIGIVLIGLLAARFLWRMVNIEPAADDLTPFERGAARAAHLAFYPLILALIVSGYLISTADGRAINVFGLFDVPSIVQSKGLEDTAGAVHEWLAYAIIALAAVHTAAALKHHLIDRSRVLMRMISGPPRQSSNTVLRNQETTQ